VAERDSGEGERRLPNRLADLKALIEVEARRAERTDDRVLVVIHKGAAEILQESNSTPPNCDIRHLGAIRGLDGFKNYATMILAGRLEPSAASIEDMMRALFGDDQEPLQFIEPDDAGRKVWHQAGRRYRLHGTADPALVSVHPDPRAQTILEQTREHEMLQAIDRLRLIHRNRPARILILSNLPLDITVNRLTTWRELIPSRLEQAAARADALPLSPAELARVYPDLWPTPNAAECDLRQQKRRHQERQEKTVKPQYILPIGDSRFSLTVRYWRQKGQCKPYTALIADGGEHVQTVLESVVGPVLQIEAAGMEPIEAAPSERQS
jgi:hypothetical protein